jgi:hypothetical protein
MESVLDEHSKNDNLVIIYHRELFKEFKTSKSLFDVSNPAEQA